MRVKKIESEDLKDREIKSLKLYVGICSAAILLLGIMQLDLGINNAVFPWETVFRIVVIAIAFIMLAKVADFT